MLKKRFPHWFVTVVAVLVLLHVAKACLFFAGGQAPLRWDSAEYWSMARKLAAGAGFNSSSVHRPPGYPAFLALHQLAFGKTAQVATVATQLVGVVTTALLTAWMCGRIARSRAALVLGLALPLAWMEYPYLALYSLSDSLLCVLFTAFVAGLVAWMERPTVPRVFLAGLLLGAAMLVKPVVQLAWVPALIAMVHRLARRESENRLRDVAVHGGVFLLTLALSVGPWLLFNRTAHGEAFLVKFTGRSLWYSCFNRAGAGLDLPDTPEGRRVIEIADGEERRTWHVFEELLEQTGSEIESDDAMRTVALQAIGSQPHAFAVSVAERWVEFWTTRKRHGYWKTNELLGGKGAKPIRRPFEIPAVANWHAETLDRMRLVGPIQLLAPLFALIGLVALARERERRSIALALGGLVLYVSLAIAVAILPMYRYRIPIDPLVVVSAVSGWAVWLRGRT